jgi:hypothetical protein
MHFRSTCHCHMHYAHERPHRFPIQPRSWSKHHRSSRGSECHRLLSPKRGQYRARHCKISSDRCPDSSNGGSAVTTYTVYKDAHVNPANVVCTVAAPGTTCSPSHAFAAGTTYSYLITASNDYGEGVVSGSLFAVETSAAPDAIATAPTTALSGATVEVSWAATADARSSAVTSYTVEFLHHGTSTYTATAQCDGTDP